MSKYYEKEIVLKIRAEIGKRLKSEKRIEAETRDEIEDCGEKFRAEEKRP